jgi:hypothetical protein
VGFGQLTGESYCLLIVRKVILQQCRYLAVTLAGQDDEFDDNAKHSLNLPSCVPYGPQFFIGKDALTARLLGLFVVLQGIVFEMALCDRPIKEDLGVNSCVVLLGRCVLQPCQFLGDVQLRNIA